MHIDANRGGQLSDTPMPRPAACYNLISVAAPFLGFFAACIFGMVVEDKGYGTLILETWIWVQVSSFFVGFVLAIIALGRSERLRGLTVFGLILNALPLLLLCLFIIWYSW
jgi:hypothetical protein